MHYMDANKTAGEEARRQLHKNAEDTGCSSEDLPEAMNDREKWRERVRDICASGTMMMMRMMLKRPQLPPCIIKA